MKKVVVTFLLSMILSACSTPKAPPLATSDEARATLAETSYSVSRSMVDLAELSQAARPFRVVSTPPNPASYGMGELTSVDWSGPVEPLVRQIAKASDYRVRVVGRSPAIPVMVSIYSKNTALGDVLRDVAYQCGHRANIVIYPEYNTIELRYSRN